MINRVVLLALGLALDDINSNRLLDLHVVIGISDLVRKAFKMGDFQLAAWAFVLADSLENGLDPGFHWGIDSWGPSAFLARIGFLFLTSTLGTWLGPWLLLATLVVGVLLVVLVFFLIFLVVIWQGVCLRDFT